MQLLIAARNKEVSEFIVNVLACAHPQGFASKHVTTGQEVFTLLAGNYKPDVFIVELDLPHAEGCLELLKALSNNPKFNFPKLVVVDVSNAENCGPRLYTEYGISDIIYKPLNERQVLSKINNAVTSRSRKPCRNPDQLDIVPASDKEQKEPGFCVESIINNEVVAMLQAFKAKSDSFYAHSIHVAYLAVDISNIVRLNGNGLKPYVMDADKTFLAGLLHDTGKLSVPDRILLKNGELTPRERETMNLHTIWGAEYLCNIKSLREYSVYAYQHHEPSYPKTLPVDEITVPSRVISIADKFSAMVVSRRYRKAIPPAATVELLMPDIHNFFGKSAGVIARHLQHTAFTDLHKKEQIISDIVFTSHRKGECCHMNSQTATNEHCSHGGGNE